MLACVLLALAGTDVSALSMPPGTPITVVMRAGAIEVRTSAHVAHCGRSDRALGRGCAVLRDGGRVVGTWTATRELTLEDS